MMSNQGALKPVIALLVACLACSGGSSSSPEPSRDGSIETDWNVASVAAGGSLWNAVAATDAAGAPVSFKVLADDGCATAAASADGLTVQAGPDLCEGSVTVTSATGLTKQLTVIVSDPTVMDIGEGLLIRFVNQYQALVSAPPMYMPVSGGDGWYPLGAVVSSTDPSTVPSVLVKDSRNAGLLAAPIDYVYNAPTFAADGVTVTAVEWRAVCPAGFVAVGGLVSTPVLTPPSQEAIRCVKESFTTPGSITTPIYTGPSGQHGGGVLRHAYYFEVQYPEYVPGDELAPLKGGGAVGCNAADPSACPTTEANVLVVPLPVAYGASSEVEPRLTGYHALGATRPVFASAIRVPFTIIASQAPGAHPERVDWNVNHSPFYTLERLESYKPIGNGILDNRQNPLASSLAYTVASGFESTQSSTFTQEVGLELTAGGDAKFLGSGGSWEVKVTGKLGWETSDSTTYTTSTAITFTMSVPPGVFAQIVQQYTRFQAIDQDGEIKSTLEGNSSVVKYLQYPLP